MSQFDASTLTGAHSATVAAPGDAVTCGDAAGDRAIGVEHRPAHGGGIGPRAVERGMQVRDELAARGLGHRAAADAVGDDEQQRRMAGRAVRVLVAVVQAAARRRDRGVDPAEGDAVAGLARRRRQGDAGPGEPRRRRLDRRHQAARRGREGHRHLRLLAAAPARARRAPAPARRRRARASAPAASAPARPAACAHAVERDAVVAVDDDDAGAVRIELDDVEVMPGDAFMAAVDDQRLVARAADAHRQQRRRERQGAHAGGMREGQAERARVAAPPAGSASSASPGRARPAPRRSRCAACAACRWRWRSA